MALTDDVIALVHDLSSAGLAVTLIGTPARAPEECKSENQELNSQPVERGHGEASTSKDGSKQQKYSSGSAEVCPTRDREVLHRKLAKKIDVRYLNEIKSFKDKIKSSYLLNCNQQQCPFIQERLNQHQHDHHSNYRKADNSSSTRMKIRDQGINVSPTLSRMRLPKFTLPLIDEGRLVQTDITMKDFSPNRIFAPTNVNKITSDSIPNEIPLKRSQTREVLPTRNFYKEHLHAEILNWLQSVPMFYSLNFTTKDIKDNIVNNLAEKINALTCEAREKNYELKIKIEIDNCLSRLPMWLHGTKKDQILFKDSLRQRLWNKIQAINEKFFGIKYQKTVEYERPEEKNKSKESYEQEIDDWAQNLQMNTDTPITRLQVVELIKKRLSPLLKIPLHTTSYKLILKGEIIDVLDDLPLTLTSPKFRTVQLNRFAEELANRLLSVQIKRELSNPAIARNETVVFHQCASHTAGLPISKPRHHLKKAITDKIGDCLNKVAVCHRNDLKLEICSTFLDPKDCLRARDEISIKNEICKFLRDTGKITGERTNAIANMIIKNVRDVIKNMRKSATTSFDSVIPQLSGTISVYRWGSEKPAATSTPKKPSKKEIPKLNAEESAYMTRVAALIRIWMDTLPKQYNEDKNYKETIINDLAGDLMDELKVEQLVPEALTEKEKYQKYLMYRWLYKFQFFDDATIRDAAKPHIADFLRRLKEIPVPRLVASQHGTRQAMENIKHMQGEFGWNEDYVPKGIDVLEDHISIWMNEQPSEIYANKDKGKRDKMVHDLALKVQDHLRNKSPDSEIDNDIKAWLQKVIKPKELEHLGLLSQDLKDKVTKAPQDKTLAERNEERQRYMAAKLAEKRQRGQPNQAQPMEVSNFGNIEGDPDKTIKEFIAKYIEHNYEMEDPLALGAFSQLLKRELRKLTPPTRKEVYDNFDQSKPHEKFMPQNLNNELEYIKIISDWLKNIPIDASYNTPGNKDRIEYINDLAKNIQEIEEQRIRDPNAMEYNYLMASMIQQSMNTYELPILSEHRDKTPVMVDQLLQKLASRAPSLYTNDPVSTTDESLSLSLNMSDIKEQNLSEFIADYIRINGRDIADDEMKLEAWTARLLKEIKKMIHDGADPKTLCKANVYDKFSDVPIPTDESVRRFSLEIAYIKEITDWMKNLPLLPVENQPGDEEKRIEIINELAEQMVHKEAQNTTDKNLEDYITTWITRLPLDQNREIVVPILVQQLMNRMQRVNNRGRVVSETPQQQEPQTSIDISEPASIDSGVKKGKGKVRRSKSVEKDSKEKPCDTKKCSPEKCPLECMRPKKTPAEIIVEAIENFSNKLPIKGDDKEAIKSMKEGIARKLYQKIGELNVDPIIFNDDLLYLDMFGDEIDTQLENVPQNSELQNNREQLKESLLNTILDTNKIIKEKSVGDNYKHKLETTLDASIPNPVQSTQAFDPGFDIYKNHLANMFILDNFDHADDDVKLKYERRIKYEIDKYFESAQNKNALPLSKDQMYNELYSALFKVPMPNESSVIDEVEQVKTRCEVDTWFEDLPIKQADDLGELLEWDKILATLAKKIHEIEKADPKADKKIHKEITKWLEKLPLVPGHEGLDVYAKKLQSILKETAEARKYVPPDTKDKSKGKKLKQSKDKKGSPNTSQIPGPSGGGQTDVATSPTSQSIATNAKPCLLVTPMAEKKPGDIIVEVVEEWCKQLPLISTEENNNAIRDNISTRIIIQISELNMDPEIFNDDVGYDELLDEELENVLSNLPVCCDFAQSKPARKYHLKEIIKSIKPLLKEEKARHEYKEELNATVDSILSKPHDTSAEKNALFNKIKDDIVENFVQYNYNKNDEESKQLYKCKLHDAVVKYFIDIRDKGTGEKVDPLIKRNQLLCELGKIPVPNRALKEEVEEIKMKNEVEQFFREVSIPDGEIETKMKKNLSKRLCDVEKSGHNSTNEKKMKADISRCLKKLNKDVSPETIEGFVDNLRRTEAERKTPPMTISQAADLNQSSISGSPKRFSPGGVPFPQSVSSKSPPQQGIYTHDPSQSVYGERWVSAGPTTPPPHVKNQGQNESYSSRADQSLGQSSINYKDFERGNFLNSSAAPQGYAASGQEQPKYNTSGYGQPRADQSLGQSSINYKDFERGNFLNSSAVPRGYAAGQEQPKYNTSSYSQPIDKSMSRSPQRKNGKEIPEMPTHPSYGQIATPRQVAQSPQYTSQSSSQYVTADDATPESLFQTPVFSPVSLHRPLPVPIVAPFPVPSAVPSMHGSRRSLTGTDNMLMPSARAFQMGPAPRRPRGYESSDEEEICRCERCTRVNCRGVPMCMVAMDDYYDECIGFGPVWCGMRYPECYYY